MKKHRRLSDRFCPKNNDLSLIVFYMGEKFKAKLNDMSNEGLSFSISKQCFSIIDYSLIKVNFIIKREVISQYVRVIYSQKIDSSGLNRRYGGFFIGGTTELQSLKNNLAPLKRTKRDDICVMQL